MKNNINIITSIIEIIVISMLLLGIKRTIKLNNKQPLTSYRNIINNLLYQPTKPYLFIIVISICFPFATYFILYLINTSIFNGILKYNLFDVQNVMQLVTIFTIISLSFNSLPNGFLTNQYQLSKLKTIFIPFVSHIIITWIFFSSTLSLYE